MKTRYLFTVLSLSFFIQPSVFAAITSCSSFANTEWMGTMTSGNIIENVDLSIKSVTPITNNPTIHGYWVSGTVAVTINGVTTNYTINSQESSCIPDYDLQGQPTSIYLSVTANDGFELWTNGSQNLPLSYMSMQSSQYYNNAYLNFKGGLSQ